MSTQNKNDMQQFDGDNWDYKTDDDNKMCLVRWKDNRVVTCATNFNSINKDVHLSKE